MNKKRNNTRIVNTRILKHRIDKITLKSFFLVSFFVLFFSITIRAQVTVKTDTTKIRIGEQIELKYIVDKQEGVQFPKIILDSLKKLEVVKSFSIDTVNNQLIKKYALTGFDSGRYELPKQLIRLKEKQIYTKPIIIDVGTVAVDTTKQKLFPIKSVQSQKFSIKDYAKNYWYAFPIFLILAILIWYFFIRKKETEEEKIAKIPPFEMAVQQLASLDEKLLWQNNKTKQYYSELTDIIRVYIEKELQITAMESTTNELVNNIKKINNRNNLDISNKIILKLKGLLQEADLVKFAKSKPFAEEIQMHRNYADIILEGLKFEEIIETEAEITYGISNENSENNTVDEIAIADNATNYEQVPKPKEIITKKKPFYKRITKKQRNNLIALCAFALMYPIGYKGGKLLFENIKNSLDVVTNEQLLSSEWQLQNIGDVSIATPVLLIETETPSLPEEIQNVLISMKTYGYINPVNKLQLVVISTVYNKEVEANLEGAVGGAISNMEAQKGVSDLKYTAERINGTNKQGARVFGTFVEDSILTAFEMRIFVENNKAWMLLTSNKEGDEDGNEIKQRVLESFKIETNAN